MKKYILIVDDDENIRNLLSIYLENEGFNTIKAENAKEALEILAEKEIELILLDIMMPKIDGLTVLENIRTVSDIPIILLTAKSQEEDKLYGYDIGADDYVTKPFSPKILVAKVKALLKRTADLCENQSSTKNYNGLTINKLAHEIKPLCS